MKVFLDSSVIIFGLEKPDSNSAKVLEALVSNTIDPVINEKVIQEVRKYVRKRKGKQAGYLVESFLRKHTCVVDHLQFEHLFQRLKTEIKRKDVEHLATARGMGIPIIVAFDRDFKSLKEYLQPREFIELLGEDPADTQY